MPLPYRFSIRAAFLAAFLLAMPSPAFSDTTELVPPRLLIKPVQSDSFLLSPDGKTMVNVTVLSQQSFLQFTDLTNLSFGEAVNLGPANVDDLQWLTNDTLLMVVEKALYTFKVGAKEARRIASFLTRSDGRIRTWSELRRTGTQWKIANVLRDTDDVVLLAATNLNGISSLHRMNTLTGEMTTVADGEKLKANAWMTDAKGNPAMAIRFKHDRSVLHYVRHPERDKWVLHDKLHRDGQIKLDYDGSRYLLPRAAALAYGANDRSLFVAENLTSDRYQLVEYNPVSGEVVRKVFEDDAYDVYAPKETGEVAISGDGELSRLLYTQDHPTVVWFTEEGRALQAAIKARVKDAAAYVVDVSESGDVALVRTIDVAGREKIHIYRQQTDDLVLHTNLHEHLMSYDLPETSTVEYTARDGHKIEAYLTQPKDRQDDSPLPLIVMPHGGPFARSDARSNPHAQFFASRGYAVLDPNFRGSTGFGQSHLSQGFRQLGGTMIDDIADATDWAIDKGIADPQNVFVVGASYGGYAALMSAIRYPDRYSGLVAHAAVTDLRRQIKSLKKKDAVFAYEYWQQISGGVYAARDELLEASPLSHAAKLKVPHLLFHGAQDNIVNVEQTELMEKELLKYEQDANVRILARTGHEFGQMSDHLYYLEQTLEHLNKWQTQAAASEAP